MSSPKYAVTATQILADRIPNYPQDWERRQLHDFAKVKGGKRLPAGEEFADCETQFPYLRVTDMVNGTIDGSNVVFVKPHHEPLIRNYKISSDDIYVTIAGTLGQFGRIPRHFDSAQLTENAAKITEIDTSLLDLDYLCYFLRSEVISAQVNIATGVGAGVPKLPLYQVEALSLAFPRSLPQQRKIARILTTVDNLIEKTEALIAKFQAITQGIMHDLFTRGVDAHGHLRPPYEEAPELYKPSELGCIPKEWEVVTVRDFATDDDHAIVDGPFGSNLKTIHYRNSGVRVIQSGFVTSNRFFATDYIYVDEEKFRSEIRSKVSPGDIVMAKIGAQCGTSAILPNDHPVSILAGNCLKITVGKNNHNLYLESLLHYLYSLGHLALVTSTTAQPAISMSSLKQMLIRAVPSVA